LSDQKSTALLAIEARKLALDLRVRSLRGAADGLRDMCPSKAHPFWTLADTFSETAQEIEELGAEWFMLAKASLA
jgi:hypothetical protein